MPKRSIKRKNDSRPVVELPKKKPAANKAKPPRPVKKRDIADIDRADSEGMGQLQGQYPQQKRRVGANTLNEAQRGKPRAGKRTRK